MRLHLWWVSLALMGQGADLQMPAPERLAVQGLAGLRVCDADHSHPRALVASDAASPNASEPAILSAEAHYATLTHPEVRKNVYLRKEKAHQQAERNK